MCIMGLMWRPEIRRRRLKLRRGGGAAGEMGDGREGDWECLGCNNRNYAFRSFCNRCKQPRLFMDNNTSQNSKWLPRTGDWICTGSSLFFFFSSIVRLLNTQIVDD
ncbi:hypothetical protein F2Q70_00029332 [Brassica cretica]|uniref:RanBP2-type domain-containing protein n=1 Tax=Brassica cretica TaxID=69181 RepID=A0A8S9FEM9_BRACR|nr:hypothetical protein F2Q70_00029332 [Brassica cretica]